MKPKQRQAELRRNVARWARRIKDAATFEELLSKIDDPKQKRNFYFSVREFLRFTPKPLEDIIGDHNP